MMHAGSMLNSFSCEPRVRARHLQGVLGFRSYQSREWISTSFEAFEEAEDWSVGSALIGSTRIPSRKYFYLPRLFIVRASTSAYMCIQRAESYLIGALVSG